jgi:hypothetical protein
MTTATLPLSTGFSAPESAASGSARKGLLRLVYDALMAARMRHAMQEIAMHRHLVPDDVRISGGHEAWLANDQLPFTRAA